MMECTLGEFFVQKNMIEPAKVERALASQVTNGGRIGTNLVELGYLNLDQIAHALSRQHGVPVATTEAFESISSAVLGAVPRELCSRYNVVPLRVVGTVLHVAMMDPQHLTLVDRLGAAVGMPIQAYASPQLRLLYYLERHYGVRRPERYLRIPLPEVPIEGDRRSYLEPSAEFQDPPMSRVTGPALPAIGTKIGRPARHIAAAMRTEPPPSAPAARPAPVAPPTVGSVPEGLKRLNTGPALPAAQPGPLSGEIELIDLQTAMDESIPDLDIDVDFCVEEEPIVEPIRGERAGMRSLDEALERLTVANSRQALVKQMIHPILPETSLNLLTLVRGEVAIALGAWGTDLTPASVRTLVLPLGMDSLFSRAFRERTVVRASAATCRLQRMVSVFFRSPRPREACITPIVVDGKVVNLICAHSAGPFADNAVSAMKTLADRAAEAYQRLIDATKV